MDPDIAAMLLLEREAPPGFVTRFQQTTPAITAKGVEDTAFYRYCRLISLNDVGGDPSRFGIDVGWFHASCVERLERFPQNLLTTQTHDAKRSADVRARIDALSSMPDEWAAHVGRWFELTESHRDGGAPDDVERYFLFQTLVGAWPIGAERIEAYMEKALREAKRNTNWIEPNADWEEAVRRFSRSLYTDEAFLADFEPFARRVAAVGERASLGQLVLKLTAPGIPDMYEGDELAFRALVDPDNRRPVDFDWRQAMLRRLMGGATPDAETRKLFATLRLLGLRARRPEPFAGTLRADRRRPLDLRVRARRRRARRRGRAKRTGRGDDRSATRTLARRAPGRGALVRLPDPGAGHRLGPRDRRVRAALVELAEQFVEVEVRTEFGGDVALLVARPLLGRPVPHQFERVAVRIDDIYRLVRAVVGVLADRPVDAF